MKGAAQNAPMSQTWYGSDSGSQTSQTWYWSGYGGQGQYDWYGYQSWNPTSRRSSWDSNATGVETEAETPAATQAAAPVPMTASTTTEENPSEPSENSWPQRDEWQWTPTWWSWSRQATPVTPAVTLPELLPEFVQGWYLLQDAGLTVAERNLIQTAVQNDFSLQRVAQELRSQFHDIEQHRREHRPSGHLGTIAETEEDEDDVGIDEGFNTDELDPEDLALWTEAAEEIEQACAVIQNARRTLKEARAKQSAVRLARKYYKPANYQRPRDHQKPRDDSQMVCLKCGVKGHRAANAPKAQRAGPPGRRSPLLSCASRTKPWPVQSWESRPSSARGRPSRTATR